MTTSFPPAWYPDPYGRHGARWFDGGRYTENVADDGPNGQPVMGFDPAIPGAPMPAAVPGRRKRRKMTWVVLAFNVLMLVWIIAGANSSPDGDCGTLDQETCDAAADVGTAIGVGILIFLWAAGDVILGVIWLVTDRRARTT